MNSLKLIASLLKRQHQNELALAAAVEELNHWVEQRGSVELAENVRNAMFIVDRNLHPFREGIAALLAAADSEDVSEKPDLEP
ncbi:hypothetical protein A3218_05630 [Pseudomonas chlororaphis]|uniref:hypothetical protein n=1 Tax=Pseudomonas chlororaphis TaxID=587753 RepID=UPI000789DF42|nr:hypothetical protein [Pseudomonas chlororaphis]AMS13801.1 hypothetical protein A3218_05630 [Pseudomonas chlororaphis]